MNRVHRPPAHTRRAAITACLCSVLCAAGARAAPAGAVSLEQARAEHEAGTALLVDIREPDEHATGVVPGARLLPLRQLKQRLGELPRDRPLLLICHTQGRSSATLEALRAQGWTNVRYVEGGMRGWHRRGWKTVQPPA